MGQIATDTFAWLHGHASYMTQLEYQYTLLHDAIIEEVFSKTRSFHISLFLT